jgi:hypothetical protein
MKSSLRLMLENRQSSFFLGSSLVLPWVFLGSSLVLPWFFLGSSLVLPWFCLGSSRVPDCRGWPPLIWCPSCACPLVPAGAFAFARCCPLVPRFMFGVHAVIVQPTRPPTTNQNQRLLTPQCENTRKNTRATSRRHAEKHESHEQKVMFRCHAALTGHNSL